MNITKDQMRQLAPEEQETMALLEIERIKRRERLLEQARYYRAAYWLPAVMLFPLYLMPLFLANTKYGPALIMCVGASLWFLIQFHAAGINRPINALMELLEVDKMKSKGDS